MFLSGFQFDKWKHLISTLEKFAKHNSCKSIDFFGREGWEKKVKEMGFKKIHTVFSMPISYEDS